MPRKVTKTMREARKRAARQKRDRRAYQAQLADRDFNWGGTETRCFSGTVENKSSKPSSLTGRKQEEPVFIDIQVKKERPVKSVQTVSLDFEKIEQRVVSQMSEEEYAAREAAAQAEIERKKNCIAPAYSKGAYQYIGSEEMARYAGKKNS